MDACEECGYAYELARDDVVAAIRALAADHADRLTAADPAALRSHPVPGTWSALEYGCHVRDVLSVQRDRIAKAQREQQPSFDPMRREERVTEERYGEQDPVTVAAELRTAADDLAADLVALDDAGWARTGIYNWPTTEVRTVEWIALHTVHEARHHLFDVDRLLSR